MYYLANRIARVHATDIYGQGDFADTDAFPDMLLRPEKYAPFPYREDRLVVQYVVQYMDGCDLKYPTGSFDIAFSFSSIEHFGSHERSGQAMREMARVLRPGGTAVVTTEVVLNRVPHPEFFLPDEIDRYVVRPCGLRLVEPIDFAIAPQLLEQPIDLSRNFSGSYPHVVLKAGAVVFTSIIMFLQKPRL
jgi:SAM-dependent methyltransferase